MLPFSAGLLGVEGGGHAPDDTCLPPQPVEAAPDEAKPGTDAFLKGQVVVHAVPVRYQAAAALPSVDRERSTDGLHGQPSLMADGHIDVPGTLGRHCLEWTAVADSPGLS